MGSGAEYALSGWHIYMVRCADGTLYTGVTTDLARRIAEHNGVKRGGARYTRCRRPVELVWYEAAETRALACKREYALKGLSRQAKLKLVEGMAVSGLQRYG